MTGKTSSKDYWNNLYVSKETGWDIGYPSPPVRAYIDQLERKYLSILIPGCGNAYEAAYLLEAGFSNITLIDIAPTLTEAVEKKFENELNKRIRVITGNFFEHRGQYDLVIEQTFLSALDPSLREAYATKMHELLKPGGRLAGVLFKIHFDQNPPYGGTIEEYEQLFAGRFEIKTLEACYNSIERRQGNEAFINLVKK